MDEMKLKLTTIFMKNFVAKMISNAIKKKFGCDIEIQLNELNIDMVNGKLRLHTDLDLSTDSSEVIDMIKSFNSDI